MPLGFGIGEIIGLVRETRGLEGSAGRIAIAGPGARELATELAAGGDPSAIAVDGDPLEALVAVRLIEGDPSEGDDRGIAPDRARRDAGRRRPPGR